jgi:hypothetical protein
VVHDYEEIIVKSKRDDTHFLERYSERGWWRYD